MIVALRLWAQWEAFGRTGTSDRRTTARRSVPPNPGPMPARLTENRERQVWRVPASRAVSRLGLIHVKNNRCGCRYKQD